MYPPFINTASTSNGLLLEWRRALKTGNLKLQHLIDFKGTRPNRGQERKSLKVWVFAGLSTF
jgi:hypothetical protein